MEGISSFGFLFWFFQKLFLAFCCSLFVQRVGVWAKFADFLTYGGYRNGTTQIKRPTCIELDPEHP